MLSPDLLVLALIAGLVGAMTNLTVAFVAGVGLGVVVEVLNWNITNPATVELILFALLLVVLLLRVAGLQKGIRKDDRSTWLHGAADLRRRTDAFRRRVGASGVGVLVVVVVLLPLVLSPGRSFLLSRICIYAVVALSLQVLTGWAGQVSLGQFGLVAVGAIMAARPRRQRAARAAPARTPVRSPRWWR